MKHFLATAVLSAAMALPAFAADYTVMAPAAPGGGWDQTARAIQEALQTEGISSSVQVVNVPGAGGTIGLAQFAQQAKGQPAAEKPEWSVKWKPDTAQLFRYSALTYNAHRIHYDLPYTQEKEGYPPLVVNGGLTALMLVESARPHLPGPIVGYDARALAPLFIGQAITLNTRLDGDTAQTWAAAPDGGVHYRVNIAFKRR